jgi:hypothetical protein
MRTAELRLTGHDTADAVEWSISICEEDVHTLWGEVHHLCNRVRSNLQNSTDTHDCRPEQDRFLPAKHIANEEGGYSSEETANVLVLSVTNPTRRM